MRVAAFIAAVLLVSVCSLVAVAQEQDVYSVLGLKKNANIREIKKAYKSLVKEWYAIREQHFEWRIEMTNGI